ncbi:MAG: transposase, partial [Mariprofundaceae bacterium]|nr:transposase [Mariprofundaceae bacterium]
MGNHIHLAIQVSNVPLSNIMQNSSFRYIRWFNYRQKRFGHLFQGRYKAILIDHNTYFLDLVRYIHLNPVRAKMVKDARDYEWSGHRAYLGGCPRMIRQLFTGGIIRYFFDCWSLVRLIRAYFTIQNPFYCILWIR